MKKQTQRGSVLIESALVLSLLLALLVGMTELGRRLLAYNFVTYAAREATRYAEVHGAASPNPATAAAVERYVKGLAMGVDARELRVKTEWRPDNQVGSKVRVEVAAAGLSATSEVTVLH